ncbi:AraC family transcriptional regulator [Hoeflea sp. WL0058]|uniref:AraC family transcriptional regulator n=1 Tax=Flavimaribacter sediminis TaxID=2865987 RepID=A0AAE2ZKM7_9HYPH|nr:AraC family transcriptional regulator [Flavimaribacter sediminis]MBW8636310.1 AraC family transcriptional regulator [Flavimaribacter sediminis]
MSDGKRVPFFLLDKSIVGKDHLFDAWREQVQDFYDVEPCFEDEGASENVRAWLVGSLVFSNVTLSKQSISRHSGHVEKTGNYLSLQVYRSGSCRGICHDVSFEMVPGEVHIFDFSRERYLHCSHSVSTGVIIPHEAVGYDPGRHPPHIMFPRGAAITHLLQQCLFAILKQAPLILERDANSIKDGFCDLLKGLLQLSPDDEHAAATYEEARRKAMRSYLDKNLADPDLDVDRLSKEFDVSKPTVYRDFAEAGGLAQYIKQRRLDRAYLLLVSGPLRYGKIREVAARIGFDDPARFSKLFRQRFGVAPSSVRSAVKPQTDRNSARRDAARPYIGDWFKGIT